MGLSVARAIGLGIKKPVIGVSNLEACASYARQNLSDPSKIIHVLIDARRGEVYSQQFKNGEAMDEARRIEGREVLLLSDDKMYCVVRALKSMQTFKQAEFEIAHTLATAPISIIAKLGIEKGVNVFPS